jgi:predicted nucleotidyltransferase
VSASYLADISEMTEGLENRLLDSAKRTSDFFSLAEAVKSKRYTMSKIRRIIIAALLDFTKDIYSPEPDYIRVLGMNRTGAEILKKAKKNCSVPIITKAADFKEKSRQFELDTRATDIAALCAPDKSSRFAGADFTHSPVIMPN